MALRIKKSRPAKAAWIFFMELEFRCIIKFQHIFKIKGKFVKMEKFISDYLKVVSTIQHF
ncbi:hypothetical protein ASG65_04895 [Bacillus sp. Leaf13]|nr:hypothetical protein ASG65_04895 [Bacillus sp. Leaf13]KRF67163.1 hypothetical protein ASG99_17490 [Bacillus sp. Soil768D1]